MAADAVRNVRVWGRPPAASRTRTSRSRITMNCHGCWFALLPDQRAASAMAASSSSVGSSGVKSRICRTRTSGRTASRARDSADSLIEQAYSRAAGPHGIAGKRAVTER